MTASGAAVLTLDTGRANAIGPELVARLGAGLDRAQEDAAPVVLTGSGKFFSAGLDLTGLPSDRPGMSRFLGDFEDLLARLFLFPTPTVAAVNGHAVAGGAILAAACDFRLGAEGDYRVGVSEVSLGVVFPAIAFEILRAAIPATRTSGVLLRGALTGPEEAVQNGFLHELAPPEELLPHARTLAGELGALPRGAYEHTKLELRNPYAGRAAGSRDEKREGFLETWFSPESTARRAALLKPRS